jgi:mannosyltransferase OCH1-like enzyme
MIPLDNFDGLMKQSKHFRQDLYNADPNWKLLKNLYMDNFINKTDKDYGVLPKKIHQCWLGGTMPDKYKRLTESWQRFHPSWEYRMWTDADVEDLNMERIKEFKSSNNMGTRSDIMSYEILRQHGGLYVDTDFECLKPFDELTHLSYFLGMAYDIKLELYHGLMASTPNHPIVTSCIENQTKVYDGEDANLIMDATGPYHLTRCFLKSVGDAPEGVVVFPFNYFYPLPNYERWTNNPYLYVKPSSYAIHHWFVSWLKQ